MAAKLILYISIVILATVVLAAPTIDQPEIQKESAAEKDDLKPAASHWGGHYGGYWGGHYPFIGGHYPYSSYWGWPEYYGYGYGLPYYGHHGYWW